jgi:hypothetical protein
MPKKNQQTPRAHESTVQTCPTGGRQILGEPTTSDPLNPEPVNGYHSCIYCQQSRVKKLADDSFFLVCHHERGGKRHADILRDADSISFFHVNLPYYFIRNGAEETKKRCLWGYRRLLANLKRVVAGFDYQNKELASLVRMCVGESEQ